VRCARFTVAAVTETPASTSLLITAAALLQDRDTTASWEKPFARAVLAGAGSAGKRLLQLTHHGVGRCALRLLQHCVLPGIAAHYRWRKRRIVAWVEAILRDGATQLVVLGAGFDVLGAWIAVRHPQVRVIESDRAGSLALKARAMASIRLGASNLHLVAADLAHPADRAVVDVLEACDVARPTVIVAEGLLMYLPTQQVTALMRELAGGFRVPPQLVATAMSRDARGRVGFVQQSFLVRRWLQHRGEPFRWGSARSELASTLRSLGIALDALADPDDARDPDPCPGEWLFRGHVAPHA
jgi:O-methyltransferase involved in polyketide biosynthesis